MPSLCLFSRQSKLVVQVKQIRAQHGKKAFGPVLVDQLYGHVSALF